MYVVDEPIETIHLYIVREEAKRAPVLLPLLGALLCLAVIIGVTAYSGLHPSYEHETLRIPAQFLPPQTFSTIQPVLRTGVKTYPATTAHGILTITNGSILSGELPKRVTILGK